MIGIMRLLQCLAVLSIVSGARPECSHKQSLLNTLLDTWSSVRSNGCVGRRELSAKKLSKESSGVSSAEQFDADAFLQRRRAGQREIQTDTLSKILKRNQNENKNENKEHEKMTSQRLFSNRLIGSSSIIQQQSDQQPLTSKNLEYDSDSHSHSTSNSNSNSGIKGPRSVSNIFEKDVTPGEECPLFLFRLFSVLFSIIISQEYSLPNYH